MLDTKHTHSVNTQKHNFHVNTHSNTITKASFTRRCLCNHLHAYPLSAYVYSNPTETYCFENTLCMFPCVQNLQKHVMANEHIRRVSCLLRDDLEKAYRFCKVSINVQANIIIIYMTLYIVWNDVHVFICKLHKT